MADPGLMAGGTHGLIRTAHAVRALSEAATPPLRVEELASALGYWAAYYQTLPGVPRLRGPLTWIGPSKRFRESAVISGTSRDEEMSREFRADADGVSRLAAAVDRLGTRAPVDALLDRLTEEGARLITSRTRLLIPSCSSTRSRAQPPYGFSCRTCPPPCTRSPSDIAGRRSRRGSPRTAATPRRARRLGAATGRRDRRSRSRHADHHAIKFAEACLREYRRHPQAVYLKAALDWPLRLFASSRWTVAERARAGISIGWDPNRKEGHCSRIVLRGCPPSASSSATHCCLRRRKPSWASGTRWCRRWAP